MEQGNIIFLNGASSSGKSSIAKALQETMDGYYLHTGLDHTAQMLTKGFDVFSDGSNPTAADGCLWVLSEGNGRLTELRIGPVVWRFWKGMYRAFAALASAGNGLIIDDVVFDRGILQEAVDALHVFNVLFVGVRCPLDVAEGRERERAERVPGLAAYTGGLVHAHGLYDLEVDTSTLSAMDCALQIKHRLTNGAAPTAFAQLRNRMVHQ